MLYQHNPPKSYDINLMTYEGNLLNLKSRFFSQHALYVHFLFMYLFIPLNSSRSLFFLILPLKLSFL